MERSENPQLTRESVQELLKYLTSSEGVKLGLGVRWQIPLRKLLLALESGTVTPEHEQTFARILQEMEQEKGLLGFRNTLVETGANAGYAEVHELQQRLPQMTTEEIRRKLTDVLGKLQKAAAEMDASIEAAASDFLSGKPIESFDTVAAMRMAHLDILRQILAGALRGRKDEPAHP